MFTLIHFGLSLASYLTVCSCIPVKVRIFPLYGFLGAMWSLWLASILKDKKANSLSHVCICFRPLWIRSMAHNQARSAKTWDGPNTMSVSYPDNLTALTYYKWNHSWSLPTTTFHRGTDPKGKAAMVQSCMPNGRKMFTALASMEKKACSTECIEKPWAKQVK